VGVWGARVRGPAGAALSLAGKRPNLRLRARRRLRKLRAVIELGISKWRRPTVSRHGPEARNLRAIFALRSDVAPHRGALLMSRWHDLAAVALTLVLLTLGGILSVDVLLQGEPARAWVAVAALTPGLLTAGLTWMALTIPR